MKGKLELTWVGKEVRPKLEPRILLEDPEKSYHADRRVSENDVFDNRLIFGDNLLALMALEQEFAGTVQFIYIDPPYNIDASSPLYLDSFEHSIWLGLLRDRLELLRRMLRPDGVICVQIDDGEGDYLKVLLDELFGRSRYLTTFYVQVRYPDKTLKQDMEFHKVVERVHCYAVGDNPKIIPEQEEKGIGKFCWRIQCGTPSKVLTLGGKRVEVFLPGTYTIQECEPNKQGLKEIWATGTILDGNSSGRFFRDYLDGRALEDGLGVLYRVEGIGDDGLGFRFFTGPKKASATKGKYYQGVPTSRGDNEFSAKPISNFYDFAGAFGNCRHEGGVEFRSGKKPEAWVSFLMERFSEPGDLIMDSFAGSGTTAAVAHKLGRRWVTVELEETCFTHVIPRLTRVVSGEDATGITKAVDWKGGGGFRFYRLAPSLIATDKYGNEIINPEFNREMLAEAVCKLEGFTYAPSEELYWQHGKSTDTDFLYVTTQTLTHEQLAGLSDEVGDERTLLICCAAFRGNPDAFANLTVKKIPKAVLHKCQWDWDEYEERVKKLGYKAEQLGGLFAEAETEEAE